MTGLPSKRSFEFTASLILGWIGTFASQFSLEFSVDSFSISIVWAQIFPLVAALAFGPLGGLVAAVPGLFIFTPFQLWHENGYANIVTAVLLLIWFPWQGYSMQRINNGGRWFFHPLIAQAPYALLYGVALYFLYPPMLAMNPPFWASSAETSIPQNVLLGICLKSAYAMGFAVLTALLILKLPDVRKLLRLPIESNSRFNTKIVICAVVSLMLLWGAYRILIVLFLGVPFNFELFHAHTPQDIISALNFLLVSFLGGYLMSIYTERRLQAEDAVRESEFLFRSQFDYGNIGISITGLDKRWIRVNQYLLDMFGYTEEQMMSKTWAEMTHPDDLKADLEQFEKMLSGEISRYEMDKRFIRCDGETIYTHLTVSCYRDSSGKVQFVIASLTDISEYKEIENRLRHAQKLEAIGQLAGGVAHDFNNLLQIITGYGTMALDDAKSGRPNTEDLQTVLEAADKASILVKQILAFSKRQILLLRPLDLEEVLNEFHKMVRRMLPENIKVKVNIAPDLQMVSADRSQIEQVLMNLSVNARDAMPSGGELCISAENCHMQKVKDDQHVGSQVACVKLSVSDTGIGMSKHTLEHLFEPFYTTKEIGEGSGLGLSMAYGIVHQHQGDIKVQSAPGEGSLFEIFLPSLVFAEVEKVEECAPEDTHGGSEVILLAEDEPHVRRLVMRMLSGVGYTVYSACDGEEAVQIYQQKGSQVGLLLFDLMMPNLSGLEALERIRALGGNQPAIFASGYGEEAVKKAAAQSGAAIIHKPYRRETLLQCIREVLSS